jgi:light-regulated signal transduction histidine kinase (bacteriophytochrome)
MAAWGMGVCNAFNPQFSTGFPRLPGVFPRFLPPVGLVVHMCLWRTAGGAVEVESTPGEGSTFTLRLPH